MGFESFRVELRGGRAKCYEANKAVRELPHVRLDPEAALTPGSTCYRQEEGGHVLEMEVLDAPARVSCRFTLCHPASVESAFLDLVRVLMTRLGMDVKFCDDVRAEDSRCFSLGEFTEFAAIVARLAAVRRAEWAAAFGAATLAAGTNEVYQRIIVPRCQPAMEQPT